MRYATGPPKNTEQATMNSPPHRSVIEDRAFSAAGVGLVYADGTQCFSTVDSARH